MPTVTEDAHAVLLPAFADNKLSDGVKKYLDAGGVAILLGESREEYVARRMRDERRSFETPEKLHAVITEARRRSNYLLTAVDQEMGEISRLHDMVPQFPSRQDLLRATSEEIENIAIQVAKCAAGMGINSFLSPILDIVTGENAWLKGRTWSTDIDKVAKLSTAFIRGVQRGGVAATAKHFPGFASATGDPEIDSFAVTVTGRNEIEHGL